MDSQEFEQKPEPVYKAMVKPVHVHVDIETGRPLGERGIWWKKITWWLKEKRGYSSFAVHDCLRTLEVKPTLREAAMALFWNVYLRGEGKPGLTAKHVKQIKSLLNRGIGGTGSTDESSQDDLEAARFVKGHLAATLVVGGISYRGDDEVAFFDDPRAAKLFKLADDCLSSAPPEVYAIHAELYDPLHFDDDPFKFSVRIVLAVMCGEVGRWKYYGGEYEYSFTLSCLSFYFSSIGSCVQESDYEVLGVSTKRMETAPKRWVGAGAALYLPHMPDDLEGSLLQQCGDAFEHLKASPKQVKSWEQVATCCNVLHRNTDGVRDGLHEFLMVNADGEEVMSLFYWDRALEFAKGHISPDEQMWFVETIQEKEAGKRLERDFLFDCWDDLGETTRTRLITTEVHHAKGHFHAMATNFRFILEEELAVYPIPFNGKTTISPKRDGEKPLLLTQIIEALRRNKWVREWVGGLTGAKKLDGEDETWLLNSLLAFLEEVRNNRTGWEHPETRSRNQETLVGETVGIYRKLLGIRQPESVLARLMRIKRKLPKLPE